MSKCLLTHYAIDMTENKLLPVLSDTEQMHLFRTLGKEDTYRAIAFYDMLRFAQMESTPACPGASTEVKAAKT